MVHVSNESRDETDRRLRTVIARAELRVLDGLYGFGEFALDDFPAAASQNALAFVRDENRWSQLVPYAEASNAAESFGLFSFHFAEGQDNSGFVGWLATHLKRRFGTGVVVICGSNASRGGIYDYWGCPAALANDVVAEVRRLNETAEH